MRDKDGSGRRETGLGPGQPGETMLGPDAKALLLGVAVATLSVGVALLIWPATAGVGPIDPATQRPLGSQLWPWSLRTPLNSRFFGAFFLSVGVGAALALREQAW